MDERGCRDDEGAIVPDDAKAVIAAMTLSKWQVSDYGGLPPKHLYRRVAALIAGQCTQATARSSMTGWEER
jgi:hypothetical protein